MSAFVNNVLFTLEDYFDFATKSADYVSKITGDVGDMLLESYKK